MNQTLREQLVGHLYEFIKAWKEYEDFNVSDFEIVALDEIKKQVETLGEANFDLCMSEINIPQFQLPPVKYKNGLPRHIILDLNSAFKILTIQNPEVGFDISEEEYQKTLHSIVIDLYKAEGIDVSGFE